MIDIYLCDIIHVKRTKGAIAIAKQKGGTSLARLRQTEVMQAIWNDCAVKGFRGRCWGAVSTSRFPGSNIVMADGSEIVIIFEEGSNGGLRVKRVSIDDEPGHPLYDQVLEAVTAYEESLF